VRALAVDDNAADLEFLARQLAGLGFEVACCNDPTDALAAIEHGQRHGEPFAVVFIDQNTPRLAGESLAENIRRLPAIAETSLVQVATAGVHRRGNEVATPIDATLARPIRQSDLLACLAKLPIAPPHPVGEPVADERARRRNGIRPARATAFGEAGLRILLAEDNKINQKFVLALLADSGHHIDVVENGQQAVDAIRRADYDVVLMDIQMPILDGAEATRQIRKLPPPKRDVHILALTAHAMSGAREEYLAAGMDDYLSKPIEPAVLAGKLAAFIEKRRLPIAQVG
jgi:CheY-like chemotaxis protein